MSSTLVTLDVSTFIGIVKMWFGELWSSLEIRRYGDTEVERSYGVTELGGGRSGGSNGMELQRKG